MAWLRPDLLAGLAVWAVLVPQGLAYGELAGLSPVTGLYTAVGALFLYALVGSSRYLHVGPGFRGRHRHGGLHRGLAGGEPARAAGLASLLALVTAGFLLVGAALRLGVIARLLSTPVLAGYLTGSAVVIAVSQLGKILAVPTTSELWWQKLLEVLTHLRESNVYAVCRGRGNPPLPRGRSSLDAPRPRDPRRHRRCHGGRRPRGLAGPAPGGRRGGRRHPHPGPAPDALR